MNVSLMSCVAFLRVGPLMMSFNPLPFLLQLGVKKLPRGVTNPALITRVRADETALKRSFNIYTPIKSNLCDQGVIQSF